MTTKENASSPASSSVEQLLLAALERGGNNLETGRYLVTFKEGVGDEGLQSLGMKGMRVANARDFNDQATILENVGDADAVIFPEIGVCLVGGDTVQERAMNINSEMAADSPIESIDPEYFVFAEQIQADYLLGYAQAAENNPGEYLRGFLRAAEIIAKDLQLSGQPPLEPTEETLVLGATWGLNA